MFFLKSGIFIGNKPQDSSLKGAFINKSNCCCKSMSSSAEGLVLLSHLVLLTDLLTSQFNINQYFLTLINIPKNKKPCKSMNYRVCWSRCSDLDRIQTCNLLSRNQMRYSVAPRGRFAGANIGYFIKNENIFLQNKVFFVSRVSGAVLIEIHSHIVYWYWRACQYL